MLINRHLGYLRDKNRNTDEKLQIHKALSVFLSYEPLTIAVKCRMAKKCNAENGHNQNRCEFHFLTSGQELWCM